MCVVSFMALASSLPPLNQTSKHPVLRISLVVMVDSFSEVLEKNCLEDDDDDDDEDDEEEEELRGREAIINQMETVRPC